MFASRGLAEHALRGALGGAALYGALATVHERWWPSLILMPLAVWMLRGCPVCWAIGLVEIIAQRVLRRTGDGRASWTPPVPAAPAARDRQAS